jgi:hypothetical protein
MHDRPPPTRRRAILSCVCAVATVAVCGALLAAVVFVPAPGVVVPVAIAITIACSMHAGAELARGLAQVGRERQALSALRRQLAQLPETRHPHGL